jgi:hypothetical protein
LANYKIRLTEAVKYIKLRAYKKIYYELAYEIEESLNVFE